jgi:hypothetical protein
MKSGFESFSTRKLAAQARAAEGRLKRVLRITGAPKRTHRASNGVGTWTAGGKQPALLIKLHGGGGPASDAYASRDPDSVVLSTNLVGLTARERASEWAADAAQHPRVNPQHVQLHFSISLAPSLSLDSDRWRSIVKRQLQLCGFEGSAFIAIRHPKHGHDHAHVVVSRSRPNGRLVSLSHGRWRFRTALRQVETEHSLMAVDQPVNRPVRPTDVAVSALRRSRRCGTVPAWVDPQSIQAVVDASTNPAEFAVQLKERGIDIQITRKPDGRVRGVMFRVAGAAEWLAGTSISRELSLQKIQRQIELNAQARAQQLQCTQNEQHRPVPPTQYPRQHG